MKSRQEEHQLRTLASRLSLSIEWVSIRGEGRARFLYAKGKGKAVEASWDEEGRVWVELWDRLDEDDAGPDREATFSDIRSAEESILRSLL
jgi:hypothetical protein